MYRLFEEYAHRYDLHTPPGHYKHDHAFVIREALRIAPDNCRLLDIGCGTGVFLEAAIAAGIDGYGIDIAPAMVDVARHRLGTDRVCLGRMQALDVTDAYDVICALSWTIHYCKSRSELDCVISNCHKALRFGGVLLLQVANDTRMTGAVNIDKEPGPSAEADDTCFIHRFRPVQDAEHCVVAEYVYASRALAELLSEQHELRFANPSVVADAMERSGFRNIAVINPESISPFVLGTQLGSQISQVDQGASFDTATN
jgi:SAM-dependent methyltransferase